MYPVFYAVAIALLLAMPAFAQTIHEAHIQVQAQGAVKRPGVYSLLVGSRVADLISRAGGPRPDAALQSLNLARPLADGEQCRVPTRAEAIMPPPVPVALKGKPAPTQKVHLNAASQQELEALPGIGPKMAQAILRQRARQGRFRSLDDLREVRGFGKKRLQRLRAQLLVD
jgi:competence protein ComEA